MHLIIILPCSAWWNPKILFTIVSNLFAAQLSLNVKMLEKIWKPDTYFHNGLDSYLHTITRWLMNLKKVNNNGNYDNQCTVQRCQNRRSLDVLKLAFLDDNHTVNYVIQVHECIVQAKQVTSDLRAWRHHLLHQADHQGQVLNVKDLAVFLLLPINISSCCRCPMLLQYQHCWSIFPPATDIQWCFTINIADQYFLLPQMSNVADELPDGPADLPSCLWIMYVPLNIMIVPIIVIVINIVMISNPSSASIFWSASSLTIVSNTVLVAYTADEVEYKWLEGASPVGYEGELQLSQVNTGAWHIVKCWGLIGKVTWCPKVNYIHLSVSVWPPKNFLPSTELHQIRVRWRA